MNAPSLLLDDIHFGLRKMKQISLATDGACIGNPGPGGWACVLRFGSHRKELFGAEQHTTNNRMELWAVIEGLKALHEPCEVTVITDSQYVRNGVTQWLSQWKAHGWRKKSRGSSGTRDVLNRDLWEKLENAMARHEIKWEWVKGHAGHEDNMRCDLLALAAAQRQLTSR
jgi:ribonuclease HI